LRFPDSTALRRLFSRFPNIKAPSEATQVLFTPLAAAFLVWIGCHIILHS